MLARFLLLFALALTTGSGMVVAKAKYVPKGLKIICDYADAWCFGRPYRLRLDGKIIRRHMGIDFAAKPGTPVIAAANGYIQALGREECGGGYIVINTEVAATNRRTGKFGVLFVVYNHVKNSVILGLRVKAGRVIGTIAPRGKYAGRCHGPITHVDFSVRVPNRSYWNHDSPYPYWVDGPGKITCWHKGMKVPKGKIVAPLLCN